MKAFIAAHCFDWPQVCSSGNSVFITEAWASGGFLQGEIFPKFFQRWAKSDEIAFFPFETKKTTFFAENVKIPGVALDPLPTFRRPWTERKCCGGDLPQ